MSLYEEGKRILTTEMQTRIGAEAVVGGRVVATREHGGIKFVDLVDRAGLCQIVLGKDLEAPALQSIVFCSGLVVAEPKAPGGCELHARQIELLSAPVTDLPFNPWAVKSPLVSDVPHIETLLNHRGLSLRGPAQLAVTRILSVILAETDSYFRRNGFVEIKTPKIVGGSSEGGAGLFEIKYFERAAHLAQSPQLYKQTLAATPLERVFEIGPVFRAEKHATGRHLNEFTGIDAEMAFPGSLDALMRVECGLVLAVAGAVQSTCAGELEILGTTLPRLADPLPAFTLDEAKEIATGQKPTRANPAEDLTPEEERKICEWAAAEKGSEAVLIHSYPTRSRPFYTQAAGRKTASFDLLLRGLEISSGGLRIHDPNLLEANIRKKGLDPETMAGYLEVFKAGCPPHGGFGIGLERLAQGLLNLPNVRHGGLFPRDRNRIEP